MRYKIEILQLSVRSDNCLKQEEIYYIDDLLLLSDQELMRIPNMGQKSVNEVKEKLNDFKLTLGKNINIENFIEDKEAEVSKWLNTISTIQFKKVKLENLFLNKISVLGGRSENALKVELKSSEPIILLKYLFSLKSLRTLPNVGKTAEVEIQSLLNKVYKNIEDIYKSKTTTINTTIDLMEYMDLLPFSMIEEYRLKNVENSGINFFTIVDVFIKTLFNERELEILKSRSRYWNDQVMTIDELGKRFDVSRARINQIEKKVLEKLWLNIQALSEYASLIDIQKQYGIFGKNFISNIRIINQKNKTNFSDSFIYKALGIFLEKDYQVLNIHKHKGEFLIKKELCDIFDFNGFISYIDSLLKSKSDYQLEFKGILFDFSPQEENIYMDDIEVICEELLDLKFDIVLNINNQIIIKGQGKKPIEKYMEEILNRVDRPMNFDDIYSDISKNHPEVKHSKCYLKSIFDRGSQFTFFNRDSIYGLQSWEGELTKNSVCIDIIKSYKKKQDRGGVKVWKDNGKTIVRGGTMIDIVRQYLGKFKEPKHIKDVLLEVEKWRDIGEDKLMANLRANKKDYFIFDSKKYVGLINE